MWVVLGLGAVAVLVLGWFVYKFFQLS